MRKKMLKVPSIEVHFKDKSEQSFAEQVIKSGNYFNFFAFVIKKIVANPSLFSDKAPVKEKEDTTINNNTNKSELTAIAKILESMNNGQVEIQNQLNESTRAIKKMSEEIETLRELNRIQQSTLTETVTLLSSTQEGLELLKKLNEESKIDLVKVVQETKKVTMETESNSIMSERTFASLPPMISANPMVDDSDEDDGFEDDDLFGDSEFSAEELAEMASRYKQG